MLGLLRSKASSLAIIVSFVLTGVFGPGSVVAAGAVSLGTVSGHVTEADGTPVANIYVGNARTDAQGFYSLSAMPGPLKVSIWIHAFSESGNRCFQSKDHLALQGYVNVTVPDDGVPVTADFVLPHATHTVTVRVIDSVTGQPSAFAAVNTTGGLFTRDPSLSDGTWLDNATAVPVVGCNGYRDYSNSLQTDANGEVKIPYLDSEDWKLQAGGQPFSVFAIDVYDMTRQSPKVEVGEVTGDKTIILTLPNVTMISGHVTEADGTPVANVYVGNARTDAQGFFSLSALPGPTRVRVGIHDFGASGSRCFQSKDHLALQGYLDVNVPGNGVPITANFVLPHATHTVTVRVIDLVTGKPSAFAAVNAVGGAFTRDPSLSDGTWLDNATALPVVGCNGSGDYNNSLQTDANGEVKIPFLDSEDWKLQANGQPFGVLAIDVYDSTRRSPNVLVGEVTSDKTIILTLPNVTKVSGHVTEADGTPVANAYVGNVRTDAQGFFSLTALPGPLKISVWVHDFNSSGTRCFQSKDHLAVAGSLTVDVPGNGLPVTANFVLPQATHTVTVRVIDSVTGQPSAFAAVNTSGGLFTRDPNLSDGTWLDNATAVPVVGCFGNGDYSNSLQTDANGEVKVPFLDSEDWKLQANGQPFSFFAIDVYDSARRSPKIAVGDVTADKTILLELPSFFAPSSIKPVISGTEAVGRDLTVNAGNWHAGVAFSYRWLRAGASIVGANSATYQPTAADYGSTLSVVVTGSINGSSLDVEAPATGAIQRGTQTLTPTPSIIGNPKIGENLTAGGAWDSGVELSYQWRRDSVDIAGATAATFALTPDDLGAVISVVVTSAKYGYETVSRASNNTVPVAYPDVVTINGVVYKADGFGAACVSGFGDALPAEVALESTVTIAQLQLSVTAICAHAFEGSTAMTSVSIPPSVAAIGAFAFSGASALVQVSFRGTPPTIGTSAFEAAVAVLYFKAMYGSLGYAEGYSTPTWHGYQTVPVFGSLDLTPRPLITGSAAVGQALNSVAGDWGSGVALSFVWLRNGSPIAGATSSSYLLTPADLAATISVAVAGTKFGFTTIEKISSETSAVAAGAFTLTPNPTISGSLRVGETLRSDLGAWDLGVSFTQQWLRNGSAIPGATSGIYLLTPDDLAATISVAVMGTKFGYTPIEKTSSATSAVAAGALTLTPIPTVTGVSAVGQTLILGAGLWDAGVSLEFQWKRNGFLISGATEPSYVLTTSDFDTVITVAVTGSKTGYASELRTSNPTAAVSAAPMVLTPTPVISGTAMVGQTLTADAGLWDSGVSLGYQWLRNGSAIPDATAGTYLLSASDFNAAITVTVTATKYGFSRVSKTSSATSVILAAPLTLTATPTITGTSTIGQTLTANPGLWDSGVAFSYIWKSNNSVIAGATTATYTLTAADLGATITVVVTGTKTAYVTASATSVATSAVAAASMTLTPTPTITGNATVGQTLTAISGLWDSGVSLSFRWKRDGVLVSGQTWATYVLTGDDIDAVLTVAVTGTKAGYVTESRASAPSGVVAAASLTLTPTPTIGGNATVGQTLTANPGLWDSGVVLSYRWKRDGVLVSGQTTASYLLTSEDIDAAFTVTVSGSKSGYLSQSRTSAPTAAVVSASILLTPTPTISGASTVGQTLTANPGLWDSGVSLSYRWKRDGVVISGPTTATYSLSQEDLGAVISVTVTAAKLGFVSVSKTSSPTSAVLAATLKLSPVPTVTGVAVVGKTLTAVAGTWDSGVALSYAWKRNGVAVAGATAASYVLSAPDLTSTITVAVTGTKTGYVSVTKVSAATSIVASATLTLTPVPAITGTAKVGKVLTAKPGSWDSGVTLAYKWFASGVAIKGATAATYKLAKADAAKKITVSVTATKAGFTSVTKTSVATGKVAP